MRRKLRGLISFLLAYVSVIFFSYDIPRPFPDRSEARMPHVFIVASPPQFSRSPSPFMPPFLINRQQSQLQRFYGFSVSSWSQLLR